MKRILIAIPIGMGLLTACSSFPTRPAMPVYVDTAEVIQAQPLYRPVQVARPVRECWTERVAHGNHHHGLYAGPVAGGIIGGVLGHQLSSRDSSTPMTVAGALVGASIGHGLSAPLYQRPRSADVRRCRTVNRYESHQQLIGYRVDYRYEGQTFSTRTVRHPGRFIRVRVDVDPVDGT